MLQAGLLVKQPTVLRYLGFVWKEGLTRRLEWYVPWEGAWEDKKHWIAEYLQERVDKEKEKIGFETVRQDEAIDARRDWEDEVTWVLQRIHVSRKSDMKHNVN